MLCLLGVTACQTTAGVAPTKVACGSFRAITWSSADTPPTVKQVRAHNAVGKEICGWRPAK